MKIGRKREIRKKKKRLNQGGFQFLDLDMHKF